MCQEKEHFQRLQNKTVQASNFSFHLERKPYIQR